MKKILIALSIIFFTNTTLFSQIINSYGIKFGYVSSSQTFTYKIIDDVTTRKNGISFGAFADLFNFNNFSISPEIKYIQKGVGLELLIRTTENPDPVSKTKEYIYHNYLSIPISVVYKFNLGFGKPFLKLGPRFDILLNSDADFNATQSEFSDYKNVLGGTISFGIISNFNIYFDPFLEFSYHFDFSNAYSGENNKIKNNVIELSLGLQL